MADIADPTMPSQATGCVVLLVDESRPLEARIAGGTKSKAESIATAVNSLLNQLSSAADLDVAVVGYRGDGRGGAEVGCRWDGPLCGRRILGGCALAGNTLLVEQRTRRVPAPGQPGSFLEEAIVFPIWYVPRLGTPVFPVIGYGYCHHLLASWIASAPRCRKPPLVVSFVTEWQPDTVREAAARIARVTTPLGPPLLVHVHLGDVTAARPVLFPASAAHLPSAEARELFACSSVLPDFLVAALRQAQVPVAPGGRGMVYNATAADLIRAMSLVRAYAQFDPGPQLSPSLFLEQVSATAGLSSSAEEQVSATAGLSSSAEAALLDKPAVAPVSPGRGETFGPPLPPGEGRGEGVLPVDSAFNLLPAQPGNEPALAHSTAPPEPVSLVVLVLDRSLPDPAQQKSWARLLDHTNDLLGQIAKRGQQQVQAAVVSCGTGSDGSPDIRTTLDGPLAGRTVVTGCDLAGGSLRVVEVTEQLPNGIGGLISFTRKKPVFIELEPTPPTGPAPGLEAAAAIVSQWRAEHPGSPVPPVVLHLTHGRFDPKGIHEAVDRLAQSGAALYHLVVTLTPHPALAYPNSPERIADSTLLVLWQWTSALLDSGRLAGERRTVASDARGMVINGRFDLLLDGVLGTLQQAAGSRQQAVGRQGGSP